MNKQAVLEHCLKVEKVAGSATCKQIKTVEILLFFKVGLFVQIIQTGLCKSQSVRIYSAPKTAYRTFNEPLTSDTRTS